MLNSSLGDSSSSGYSYMKTNRSTEKKKKLKKKTRRRRKKEADQLLKIRSSTSTRSPTQIALFFFLLLQPDRLLWRCTRSPTQIALFFFLLLQPYRFLQRCVLQVLFFFKSDKNRVCKTRFWFLELESYRLEIYVTKLPHGGSRTRV